MEWLRWIVLIVGLLVIGGIVWMYRRHRSEQAVDLGGGHDGHGGYHDPIDASVGARVEEDVEDLERVADRRLEPSLDLGGDDRVERPDEDGFVDGVSPARVVWRSEEPEEAEPEEPEPRMESGPAGFSDAGEPEPAEEVPARPQPGFSSLFTRQGQDTPSAEDPLAGAPTDERGAEPTIDEDETEEPGGAVISMILVDRRQRAMPAEQVRRGIEEAGFEFGDFAIYHFRDLDGESWFSLMNAVSPGQFDPDDLTSYETPALAMFMQLPSRGADPSLVFDRMHQVATTLAESLDALLIDDRREPLDTESIDRYRELIESYR
ncbi:MAG: cell division protein ZipA C-terminal FtsZ-binding domain-containing protein [Guyparkeria sp.]